MGIRFLGDVERPVDDLENALKEIKCLKKINRGPLESEGELKKFRLTIDSKCM